MPSPEKPSIYPLLLVSFVGSLGFSIVLPSLVFLVKSFKGDDFLYGALGATYSTFQLVGAPWLGRLSDLYGRKKLLFVSEFGSTLSWMLFIVALYLPIRMIGGFSTSVTGAVALTLPMFVLFIARAVEGLTGGDVSVANAYLADITPDPEERKKDFGKMGVAGNLGFMLGPAIAGVLGSTSLGLLLPISVALGTSLAALILIVWLLPESRVQQQAPAAAPGVGQSLGHEQKECFAAERSEKLGLSGVLKMKRVPLLLAIYFVFFLAFSLFVAAMPLFATESMHWSITKMGLFFSFLSVVIVATQGPLLSFLSRRLSSETLTIWGTPIVGLGYLCILTGNDAIAFLGAGLYALGNGLMWPSFLAILSESAGEKYQGYIQGLGSSAGSLASIVGLLTGGALYTHLHRDVFYIPAALIAVVFVMSFRLTGKSRRRQSN